MCIIISPLAGGFILSSFPNKSKAQEKKASTKKTTEEIFNALTNLCFLEVTNDKSLQEVISRIKKRHNYGNDQEQVNIIISAYNEAKRMHSVIKSGNRIKILNLLSCVSFQPLLENLKKFNIETNTSHKKKHVVKEIKSFITICKNWIFQKGKSAIIRSLALIVIACLFIFILTNPTYSKFKEFTPDFSNREHYVLRTRIHNYLIFSVYEKSIVRYDDENYSQSFISSEKYLGIFLNFYKIK